MLRRSTLFVLFLFVVLLGIAVYLQRNPLSKTDESSQTSTPAPSLLSLGTASIVSLRVESGDGKFVELSKTEENGWSLVSPVVGLADGSQVDSALTQLSSVKILSQIDPAPALSAMGLDESSKKIILGLDDNRTLKIEVGIETPTQSGYYLRMDGGNPVVVSKYSVDTIIGFLDNPPVSPTPVPVDTVEPTSEPTSQVAPAPSTTATP